MDDSHDSPHTKPTTRPDPQPPSKKSGSHPAVVAMRQKVDSITEGALAEAARLDRKLAAYLSEIESVPPPDGLDAVPPSSKGQDSCASPRRNP